jgi:hypothetical protein
MQIEQNYTNSRDKGNARLDDSMVVARFELPGCIIFSPFGKEPALSLPKGWERKPSTASRVELCFGGAFAQPRFLFLAAEVNESLVIFLSV